MARQVLMSPRPKEFSPVDEFWKRVDRTGECWEWTGVRNQFGHGRIRRDGKETGTHRYSWILAFGPIPSGMLVCHRCDNPPCVRPSHLFLGTPRDNTQDMHAKGRSGRPSAPGERSSMAKFTDAEVVSIRVRFDQGETIVALASEKKVNISTVAEIVNGRTWRHIGGPVRINPALGRRKAS